ncbi:MAG: CHASE2 domain-containing protein [Verrucomicrobiota bacterium]
MKWWIPLISSLLVITLLSILFTWLIEEGPLLTVDRQLRSSIPVATSSEAPSSVIYVTIRDISDQTWPWPPLDYAILLNSIVPFFPKTVAFDHLPQASSSSREAVYERQLLKQMARLNQAVTPIRLYATGAQESELPTRVLSVATIGPLGEVPAYSVGDWPDDQFKPYPTGVSVFRPDMDGIHRLAPLVFQFRESFLPSLALQAYCQFLDADWHHSGVLLGKHILLRNDLGEELVRIPIDQEGNLQLTRQDEDVRVESVEFYSVILAAEQRRVGSQTDLDMGMFRNSLVVIGRDADGTYEPLETIFGTLSGGQFQAEILQQLVEKRWIRSLRPYESFILVFTIMSLASFLHLLPRSWIIWTLLGTGLLVFSFLSYYLVQSQMLWVSPLTTLLPWLTGGLVGWMAYASAVFRQTRTDSLWYRESELPF